MLLLDFVLVVLSNCAFTKHSKDHVQCKDRTCFPALHHRGSVSVSE